VKENDVADKFYIIVTGNCVVTRTVTDRRENNGSKDGSKQSAKSTGSDNQAEHCSTRSLRPNLAGKLGLGFAEIRAMGAEEKDAMWAEQRVEQVLGRLNPLDFFGESALSSEEEKVRKATVRAGTAAPVQVLTLSSKAFERLLANGVLNQQVVAAVEAEKHRRQLVNDTRSSPMKAAALVVSMPMEAQTRSRRSQDNSQTNKEYSQFVMVKCDLCDKWRHVEEQIDGSFTCSDIGEQCALGVML
jgi:CRP-like cAMP-binding protein